MTLPPEDEDVLRQLAREGDDPVIVRPVIHWFFGEKEELDTVAGRLEALGWVDARPRQDEDGWLMSPIKHTDLTVASIMLMNEQIQFASVGLEVTYDGWETSVERSH